MERERKGRKEGKRRKSRDGERGKEGKGMNSSLCMYVSIPTLPFPSPSLPLDQTGASPAGSSGSSSSSSKSSSSKLNKMSPMRLVHSLASRPKEDISGYVNRKMQRALEEALTKNIHLQQVWLGDSC